MSEDGDGCVWRWGAPKDKEESGSQTIRPGSSPRERWKEKLERTGFELDLEIDERRREL